MKMRQISQKNDQKMQKQTTVKTIGNENGQVNTHCFTKELDRQ
jgi:hypothetical protein